MRNREYDIQYSREYRKKNPQKIKEYQSSDKHKKIINDYSKTDSAKAKARERAKKYRNSIIEALGGKCVICEFSDRKAIQIDHINGNGNKDRKGKGNGLTFYKHVLESFINNENKYQLLCANCNWIKRVDNNELSLI